MPFYRMVLNQKELLIKLPQAAIFSKKERRIKYDVEQDYGFQ